VEVVELKLGKKEAVVDSRTIKMATLFKELAPPPEEYDFDLAHPIFSMPLPVFANDRYGDCVIASRAHQTLRFEAIEQSMLLPISDEDVINQYMIETGGQDSGLVELESLKQWRKDGWKVGDNTYKIHAFGSIDWHKKQSVMMSIYYLSSCYTGVALPESAKKEFADGKVWSDLRYLPGTWGGHAMIVTGYDKYTVTFITWGRRQKATWDWFFQYCDECYSIVDDKDYWLGDKSPIYCELLEEYLKNIT
jgi:hypothetical protein